jgi:hypothetical protein
MINKEKAIAHYCFKGFVELWCNTKKLHKLIWVFLPRAALKGRYIKINICHALSGLIGFPRSQALPGNAYHKALPFLDQRFYCHQSF